MVNYNLRMHWIVLVEPFKHAIVIEPPWDLGVALLFVVQRVGRQRIILIITILIISLASLSRTDEFFRIV